MHLFNAQRAIYRALEESRFADGKTLYELHSICPVTHDEKTRVREMMNYGQAMIERKQLLVGLEATGAACCADIGAGIQYLSDPERAACTAHGLQPRSRYQPSRRAAAFPSILQIGHGGRQLRPRGRLRADAQPPLSPPHGQRVDTQLRCRQRCLLPATSLAGLKDRKTSKAKNVFDLNGVQRYPKQVPCYSI